MSRNWIEWNSAINIFRNKYFLLPSFTLTILLYFMIFICDFLLPFSAFCRLLIDIRVFSLMFLSCFCNQPLDCCASTQITINWIKILLLTDWSIELKIVLCSVPVLHIVDDTASDACIVYLRVNMPCNVALVCWRYK